MNCKGRVNMNNVIMLKNLDHFNISQILESGQVFRFQKITDSSYLLSAKQKLIKIVQQPESSTALIYNANLSEAWEVWKDYLDLETDYEGITTKLKQKDEYLSEAIDFGQGIRILKQDPWEMLISFILSQNKAIPHIKQCISNISERFGFPIDEYDAEGKTYYTFPTAKELSRATEEELRSCKVGFRAPYILDACRKILGGEVILNDLYALSAEEAKEKLMFIKGVGPKIADCILLFAYAKTEVFPTDVWIKRVVEGLYFKGREMRHQDIQQFAKEYFGNLAGYAQQYLFFYGREKQLFKH